MTGTPAPPPIRVRVVGTDDEVIAMVELLRSITTVTKASDPEPRRREPGQWAVYLDVQARDESGRLFSCWCTPPAHVRGSAGCKHTPGGPR